MTNVPTELLYSKEHEWIKKDGNVAWIGITDFAQNALGDIIFVELPESGSTVKRNSTFGVVESIKSVSDLYSPVNGKVIEVNNELPNAPERINQNCYEAWMIKVEISDNDFSQLLDAKTYITFCQQK